MTANWGHSTTCCLLYYLSTSVMLCYVMLCYVMLCYVMLCCYVVQLAVLTVKLFGGVTLNPIEIPIKQVHNL